MRSSDRLRLAASLLLACSLVLPERAGAEPPTPVQGFAVERLYLSAPSGGWFVMNALDMRGGLGGAISITSGYAHDPLRVPEGAGHLTVVGDDAFADIGLAVSYDGFRVYLNFQGPLAIAGDGCGASGACTVGGYQLTPPSASIAQNPDTLADPRIGFDARILGTATGRFRLGAGLQLILPSGNRSDYDSDGTYRAMGRFLFAGDVGRFTYAGQLGVHLRPLDDAPAPGSPQGSELLFGVAGGARVLLGKTGHTAAIVGPEIFGETALRSFFGASTTGVEGLLSARLEGTGNDRPQVRVKVGAGAGLDAGFGVPDWRLVFAIELFSHETDTDKDTITDSKDACPTVPGVRTDDPKTNGCPAAPPPPETRGADAPASAVRAP